MELNQYKERLRQGEELGKGELKNLLKRLKRKEEEVGYEVLKLYFEQKLSQYLGEGIETESLYELEKELLFSGYSRWIREKSLNRRAIDLIGKKNEERIKKKYSGLEPSKERESWHRDLVFELIEAGNRLRNQRIFEQISIDLDDWRILCSPMDFMLVDERDKISVYPDKSRLAQSISTAEIARREEKGFKPRKKPIKWRDVSFALDKYAELIEEVIRERGKWSEIIERGKGEIYEKGEIAWV